EVGIQEILVDHWFEVVIAIPGAIRAHDRELVRQLGQLREGAAEGDPRQRRGNFARDAANSFRGRHLGIEGLDLARAAAQEEENDRLAGGQRPGGCRRQNLWPKEPVRQRSPQRERADFQEITTVESWPWIAKGEHGGSPSRQVRAVADRWHEGGRLARCWTT